MTQVIREDGSSLSVTVLEVLPAYVCGTREEGGKKMVRLGFAPFKKANKPQAGQATKVLRQHKLSANGFRYLREFDLGEIGLKEGDKLGGEIFAKGEEIAVSGKSKGRGFAGVIKRHNFHRGPESHGHDHHRAPGSIGAMGIARVLPGKRMPGRFGGTTVTTSGLKVVDYDAENNLLIVSGAVPGPNGATLLVRSLADIPVRDVSSPADAEESPKSSAPEVQSETGKAEEPKEPTKGESPAEEIRAEVKEAEAGKAEEHKKGKESNS